MVSPFRRKLSQRNLSRRNLSRRKLIQVAGTCAIGAIAVSPLKAFLTKKAMGQNPMSEGFGPLSPKTPSGIDGRSTPVIDIRGKELLELPSGFEYVAFHVSGMRMSDGKTCPSHHDGMACFGGPQDTLILVQNHELSPGTNNGSGFTGGTGLQNAYDKFDGAGSPGIGAGGCSTIILNRNGEVLRDYISLAGTIRNCAGGPTPWGSWISCEEDVTVPADHPVVTRKHGFNFEVPARGGLVSPVPLVDMGRFNHEAVAVDPITGYVYETEDRPDSSIYRYIPNQSGNLAAGGALQALKLVDGPQDTRTGVLSLLNQPLNVEWIDFNNQGVNINPDEDILRFDAQTFGAAIFARGEGAWSGNGKIFWVCTTGGDLRNGQVWCYDDVAQTVTLLVESTVETELDNPDNITVNPADGSLYLMEDGNGEQFVVGVTPTGDLFKFLRNNMNGSEFAGGCFSRDGTKFFVNIQIPGITFMVYRTDGSPIMVS